MSFTRLKNIFIINKRILYNIRQLISFRNFTFEVPKCTEFKYDLLRTVSFEDIRLQKHLKSLNNLFLCAEQSKNKDSKGVNFKFLKNLISLVQDVDKIKDELEELNVFITELKEQEDELLDVAEQEKKKLENKLNVLQTKVLHFLIPDDIIDDKDIVMEFSPGVGGQEAMLFTKDMFDMYCNYAHWKGWNTEVLRFDTTDLGGLRQGHLAINGLKAFKLLKYESGVHRVQRIPKTEKSGRIHTSTMTIAVLPQPSDIDIVINSKDIELEFKRSGGAGGQHVNTTDSCVRIYHKPSGIVVESQVQRNQHQNRELAMKSLRAKLYERELEAVINETITSRKHQIGSAARSERVRTYNFVQDRITDHRAHLNASDIESFFKGEEDLDQFIDKLQEWNCVQSLMQILNKYDST